MDERDDDNCIQRRWAFQMVCVATNPHRFFEIDPARKGELSGCIDRRTIEMIPYQVSPKCHVRIVIMSMLYKHRMP
jgi:hypothetical protein